MIGKYDSCVVCGMAGDDEHICYSVVDRSIDSDDRNIYQDLRWGHLTAFILKPDVYRWWNNMITVSTHPYLVFGQLMLHHAAWSTKVLATLLVLQSLLVLVPVVVCCPWMRSSPWKQLIFATADLPSRQMWRRIVYQDRWGLHRSIVIVNGIGCCSFFF